MARWIFSLLLVSVVLTGLCPGQTTTGRIIGNITDSSGAHMPGVSVTARSLDTGLERSATTNNEGGYVITELAIGNYEVSAQAVGFKRYSQRPVSLLVDQTVRIDAQMQVGDVTEQITVEAEVPLIETDRSSMGKVIENSTVVELPMNGRHFVRLASLVPGTTRGNPGAANTFRNYGETMTSNGQRSEHNNYMIDGTSNNSYIVGSAVIVPSIDAIQEFKVQTANYSAEFGRSAGAVINLAIKSGTNGLHGTAYEFLRNDKLNARNFFDAGRQPVRLNQFGVSVGGPVIKNKTFFFVSYEGWRERRAQTGNFIVPTDAMKAGDFSGRPTIYDPLTIDANGMRMPFANNRIPANRIHSTATKLFDRWPSPNNPADPARNYIQNFSTATNRNQVHGRADHQLTERDHLMARYSYWDSNLDQPSLAYAGSYWEHHPRSGVVGWTRTWSPKIIQDARFAYSRYSEVIYPQGFGQEFAPALGLPSHPLSGEVFHPLFTISNLSGIGGQDSVSRRIEHNYEWVYQLSIVTGRHSLKLGADVLRYQSNSGFATAEMGTYTFSGAFTGQAGSTYQNGFADFLLGNPVQQQLLNPVNFDYGRLRNTRAQLYVQDDFNVLPSLTLNVGLRWEGDFGWTEKNNRFGYLDYSNGQYVYPKALTFPFSIPFSHRFEDTQYPRNPKYKFFAPRIGFAWRPLGNNRTVVRGAYGVFYGLPTGLILFNSTFRAPGLLLLEQLVSSNVRPQLQWGVFNTSPADVVPRNPTFFNSDPKGLTDPYVQQWNFGIERQVVSNTALRISYVGSKTTHLERRYQGNGALPPAPGDINARRRFPEFRSVTQQESTAYATYHSLQASAERRFSKGLTFIAGYTWSKALDDNSGWSVGGGQDTPLAQNPNRLDLEKGRSAQDLRQRFTFSGVYEFPFQFENSAAKAVLGGWEVSGILTLQTGFPFTVFVPGDIPNTGTGGVRANVSGNPEIDPSDRTIDGWFTTSAFSNPLPYSFGTSGRNILDGPGLRSIDFGALKTFRIAERHRIQFRAEFFNLFNHPNFGIPNATVGNSAFGKIRTGGEGREIQFGLKYIF